MRRLTRWVHQGQGWAWRKIQWWWVECSKSTGTCCRTRRSSVYIHHTHTYTPLIRTFLESVCKIFRGMWLNKLQLVPFYMVMTRKNNVWRPGFPRSSAESSHRERWLVDVNASWPSNDRYNMIWQANQVYRPIVIYSALSRHVMARVTQIYRTISVVWLVFLFSVPLSVEDWVSGHRWLTGKDRSYRRAMPDAHLNTDLVRRTVVTWKPTRYHVHVRSVYNNDVIRYDNWTI